MPSQLEKNGSAGLDPVLASRLLGFALLVVVGVLVLFLRNPDPILHPVLYAEDATWPGSLLRGDPWTAYFHSRPDYLVVGQTALLDLAVSLNLALTGGTIAFLPQTLAFLSYGLWSFYAALTFVALRPFLSHGWRLLAIALILLLPMGGHANEVIGRIANLGYLFLPLSLTLVLLRETSSNRGMSFAAIVGLIVCLFTNPLCALVIAAHLAIRAVRRLRDTTPLGFIGDAVLVVALFLFAALFLSRGGTSPGAVPPNATFAPERLVELVAARSLLYPFVFGFYEFLTDGIVIAIVSVLVLLALWAIYLADVKQRLLGLSLGACLLGTTFLVVAARPWLTDFMKGYGATFPDRYFVAQNIFAILLLVWILSRLPYVVRLCGAVALAVLVISGAGVLFEFARPQLVVATKGDFAEQVARAAVLRAGTDPDALVLLDASPDGFATLLPAGIVFRTAAALAIPGEALPDLSRLELDLFPTQLAAMDAAVPASAAVEAFPLEIRALNDLVSDEGILRVTGGDPYVVYGYSGTASDVSAVSRLSFALVCVGRTRTVPMQLFWQTAERPGMDELRSLTFNAQPGRLVVPLAIHPDFTSRERLDGIRLDIAAPRACPGYRFEDVALERR